jgi:hypothetical protein
VPKMVIEVPEGFAEVGKAMAEHLAALRHRHGFAAKGVDHPQGVDAAPARRLPAGVDIGSILQGQAVDADGPVDGECNDQATILQCSGFASMPLPK